MKQQHKIIRCLSALLAAGMLVAGALVTGVSAQEAVTASQVEQTAAAAAEYLTENYRSTGYSASDLATVQLLYRSGLSQAAGIVEDYLTLAEQELTTYGGAVYQGYDQNYDPVASLSLVGTLGAAWLAEETGDAELSAQMVRAAETLGTPEFIAKDNPYNIARSLWCAEALGCSETLRDNLVAGLMTYYNQEEQAFDYWGCSVDTNTVMVKGALAYSGDNAQLDQAVEHAMTLVDSLRQEDGSYFSDFVYSTDSNADSTGLALSAMADLAASDRYSQQEMAQTYQALMDRYFVSETGAFGYMDNRTPNTMATADALEGLLTYAAVLDSQPGEDPDQPGEGEDQPTEPTLPPESTTSDPTTGTDSDTDVAVDGNGSTGSDNGAESAPAAGEASPETGDNSLAWMGGAFAALALAAGVGAFGVKKVRK